MGPGLFGASFANAGNLDFSPHGMDMNMSEMSMCVHARMLYIYIYVCACLLFTVLAFWRAYLELPCRYVKTVRARKKQFRRVTDIPEWLSLIILSL